MSLVESIFFIYVENFNENIDEGSDQSRHVWLNQKILQ